MATQEEKVVQLVRKHGVLRPAELAKHGLPRIALSRLSRKGEIERIGRGLYALPDSEGRENRTVVDASRKVPGGVICLLTALRLHRLTTQSPREVWIAIGGKDWKPVPGYPPLRIVRFSGPAKTQGVIHMVIENASIKTYNLAKTIADCFKYRNKVGLDVALEALREAWRARRVTADELWRYAKVCRVSNVMRPYLESLT
jgi:predicted transcriptional regulator of viral defense system